AGENDLIFNLSFVSKIWLMLTVALSTAFSVLSAVPAIPGIACLLGISLWQRLRVLVCRENRHRPILTLSPLGLVCCQSSQFFLESCSFASLRLLQFGP